MNYGGSMKQFLCILAVFFMLGTLSLQAQFKGGGVEASLLLPATEFKLADGYEVSYMYRGFFRNELSADFDIDYSMGFGKLQGKDFTKTKYATSLFTVDARFVYTLANFSRTYPYAYAGAGALFYHVKELPASRFGDVEASNWTIGIPAGLGYHIKFDETYSMEINAGITYTLTDNLNYYKEGSPKDMFYNLGVALVFYPYQGTPKKEDKGMDPAKDSDGDGLTDIEEINVYKTNPNNRDTDGDGLSDFDEVKTHKTDPNKADTDGDGLNDGSEVNTHKTDPMKADTDGDGLNDGAEVNTHKTNPLMSDTDGDKLSDGDEVNKYKTNPLMADSDGDNLNDFAEVMTYKTNPNKKDTDGGTVNDDVEVARGTNPNDKNDDVKTIKSEVGQAIVLEGILFNTGSAEILPASEEILMEAYNTLLINEDMAVEIQGHTDSQGNKTKNQELSLARAESVKAWLVNKGIDKSRITTKGFGPDKPIASNGTAEGRAKNRRIEFVRTK